MCCRHTRAWRGPAYAALQPCLFDLKDPQQGAMTETGVNDVTLANAAAPKQHGVMPVPVIDMSLPEDVAAKQLRQACIDVGFFYLSNHGISSELLDSVFTESRNFFALPFERKMELLSDKKSRGYSPLYEQKLDPKHQSSGDTKESIYIWGAKLCPPAGSPQCALPFRGPNQWPRPEWGVPGFQPVMERYCEEMEELMHRTNRLLALALDLPPDYFRDKFSQPALTLRPIHYTAEASDPNNGLFAAGAHSDWAHITFLTHDGTPGLQVLYKGEWVDVPHMPGTFVCNIGDMMERWTNDLFRSTVHRVVNRVRRERYSVAFFTGPTPETMVSCLPTCEQYGGGPKYPPVSSSDYLSAKYAATHTTYAAHNPDVDTTDAA